MRAPIRRAAAGAAALLLAAAGFWAGASAAYHSRHPCDWLLQDATEAALRSRGVDPDTATVPVLARATTLPEVRAAMRQTPADCLGAWAAGRLLP